MLAHSPASLVACFLHQLCGILPVVKDLAYEGQDSEVDVGAQLSAGLEHLGVYRIRESLSMLQRVKKGKAEFWTTGSGSWFVNGF